MPRISELAAFRDSAFAQFALVCLGDGSKPEKNDAVRRLYRPEHDQAWLAMAINNEIGPHIAHSLRDALGADGVPDHWLEIHRTTEARIARYMAELDRLAAALDAQGIRLVALKNAGIARGIHDCFGCTPMGDLDVLVERTQFRQAHRVVLDLGFETRFRSPLEQQTDLDEGELGGGMEYVKPDADGEQLWLELQWRPVSGRWIRPDQEPDTAELMERSIPIEGSSVRLLSPVDNLLQVALHLAKHSYVRAPGLRLHTDVDRIVRRHTIDWELFLERVIRLRVKTAVYFALAIPNELLGTPVPADLLSRLRPGRLRFNVILHRLIKAGLFDPHEKKFTSHGYIAFTAALYDDLGGLWRALFPDLNWMKEHYGVRSGLFLPAYHVKRLVQLAWRRTL